MIQQENNNVTCIYINLSFFENGYDYFLKTKSHLQYNTNIALRWGQSIDVSTLYKSISTEHEVLLYKVDISIDCTNL